MFVIILICLRDIGYYLVITGALPTKLGGLEAQQLEGCEAVVISCV